MAKDASLFGCINSGGVTRGTMTPFVMCHEFWSKMSVLKCWTMKGENVCLCFQPVSVIMDDSNQ